MHVEVDLESELKFVA